LTRALPITDLMSSASRGLVLSGIVVTLFASAVIILMQLVPGPRTPTDYLIIGCLATMIALFGLFLILITTWLKIPDLFFKRRKK
jgi:hypothetical protein